MVGMAAAACCLVAFNSRAADAVTLKVIKVDSQELAGENGAGTNAVDGDPNTFWHTEWQDSNPPPPHEIIIELSRPCSVAGFTYLPRQDDQVNGTIREYEFYVSADGKDFGQPVKKGTFEEGKEKKTVRFDAKPARFVKLKALSEINGEAWTSAAEIGIVQADEKTSAATHIELRVVKVDSEETEGENGRGTNAVDGNPATFWHTQWQDANPACPHEIILELVPPAAIKGLTYLPRQDGGVNGTIKEYELYVGDNAEHVDTPLAHGSFGEGTELKTVTFAPKTCRYLKLKALSELNGEAWTSAAEIGVVTE